MQRESNELSLFLFESALRIHRVFGLLRSYKYSLDSKPGLRLYQILSLTLNVGHSGICCHAIPFLKIPQIIQISANIS